MPLVRCFQLVENAPKELPSGYLFETWPCFDTGKWGRISVLSYLSLVLRVYVGCVSWFYCTKTTNSAQFIERLKVKTVSYTSSFICPIFSYFYSLFSQLHCPLCRKRGAYFQLSPFACRCRAVRQRHNKSAHTIVWTTQRTCAAHPLALPAWSLLANLKLNPSSGRL